MTLYLKKGALVAVREGSIIVSPTIESAKTPLEFPCILVTSFIVIHPCVEIYRKGKDSYPYKIIKVLTVEGILYISSGLLDFWNQYLDITP